MADAVPRRSPAAGVATRSRARGAARRAAVVPVAVAVVVADLAEVEDRVVGVLGLLERDAPCVPVGALADVSRLVDQPQPDRGRLRGHLVLDPPAVQVLPVDQVERADLDGVRDGPAGRQNVRVRQGSGVTGVDDAGEPRNVVGDSVRHDDVEPLQRVSRYACSVRNARNRPFVVPGVQCPGEISIGDCSPRFSSSLSEHETGVTTGWGEESNEVGRWSRVVSRISGS